MNIKDVLWKAMNECAKTIEQKNIRNADSSQLCPGSIEHMIRKIDVIQHELDILLALTESVGGFCSAYPRRCIDELGLFRNILDMELKNDHRLH